MSKSRAVTAPPPEVTNAEPNRFLAGFKSSLAKRWSCTRMETLYEIADLVAFLHALERDREAVAVASAVATSVPAPPPWPGGGVNYNVWAPAALCHAFLVHVDPSGLAGQVAASSQALLQDPAIQRESTDYIAARLAKAVHEAGAELPAKPTKGDRQSAARHLGTCVQFSVLADAGDIAFAPHGESANTAIAALRTRLARMLERQ